MSSVSVPTFVFLKEEDSWKVRRSRRKRLTNKDLRSTAGKERQRSSAAQRALIRVFIKVFKAFIRPLLHVVSRVPQMFSSIATF